MTDPQPRAAEIAAKLKALRKLAAQVRASRRRYDAKGWAEVLKAAEARRHTMTFTPGGLQRWLDESKGGQRKR